MVLWVGMVLRVRGRRTSDEHPWEIKALRSNLLQIEFEDENIQYNSFLHP